MKKNIAYYATIGLLLFPCTGFAVRESQVHYLSGRGPDDAVNWEFMVDGGMQAGKCTTRDSVMACPGSFAPAPSGLCS